MLNWKIRWVQTTMYSNNASHLTTYYATQKYKSISVLRGKRILAEYHLPISYCLYWYISWICAENWNLGSEGEDLVKSLSSMRLVYICLVVNKVYCTRPRKGSTSSVLDVAISKHSSAAAVYLHARSSRILGFTAGNGTYPPVLWCTIWNWLSIIVVSKIIHHNEVRGKTSETPIM